MALGLLDNYRNNSFSSTKSPIVERAGPWQSDGWVASRHRGRCRRRGGSIPLCRYCCLSRTEAQGRASMGRAPGRAGADCCQWTALRVGRGLLCVLYHKPEHGPARCKINARCAVGSLPESPAKLRYRPVATTGSFYFHLGKSRLYCSGPLQKAARGRPDDIE